MLTIWGRATSSNVQALMWCVGELGLAYERHDACHIHGGLDTPDFRAMNPNGRVPVLRDGDDPPLWETGAILRYLASRYGKDAFWPQHPSERAQIDKCAEWAKRNVATAFTGPVFWQMVRTPPDQRDPAALATALEQLDQNLATAEAQLHRDRFLAGADFTLADIQFGHVLYRYYDIAIARPARPRLESYYRALTDRPAFREHVMISYDVLKTSS